MTQAKSGQEVAKQTEAPKRPAFSKNDHRFWEERVFLPTYSRDGETRETGTYVVRIQAHGERRKVSLGKTQKREAGKAALKLYGIIEARGWEKGLDEFRGELPRERTHLTLGAYLAEIAATGLFTPRTLRIYSVKVRRIASDIAGVRLPKGSNKFDHVNGGAKEWQRLVDLVLLEQLTPDKVSKWRADYLGQFRSNPARFKSATRTINSCIRAGKAIFKAEVRERLAGLKLPDPLPFVNLKTAKESPNRYRSEITNPEVLLVAGRRELAEATSESEWQAMWREQEGQGVPPAPSKEDKQLAATRANRKHEAFKVLVLGLVAGLRRGEIDRLQWSQIDLTKGEIHIEATDCFAPKADSCGEIPIDPEIVQLLKTWKQKSTGRFVVAGVEPAKNIDGYHYRANRAHQEIVKWLHSKGITARNPIHTLRKEYGSLVCEKAGVYVASRLLRHASVTMTAAVYTDDRGRVTSGLGGFMKPENTEASGHSSVEHGAALPTRDMEHSRRANSH